MKFEYRDAYSDFHHEQDIEFNKPFYVIGSELTYTVKPHPMRYTIIVMDDDIPVCEVKFNDRDLANLIGEQLTRLIGNIMEPEMPTETTPEAFFWRQYMQGKDD